MPVQASETWTWNRMITTVIHKESNYFFFLLCLIEMGIKYKKKCIYNCQNSNILNFLILTRYLCYYEYKAGYKMSVYF